MAVAKRSHVMLLVVSVLVTSACAGMLFYAYAVDTKIRPFLVAVSCLFIASIVYQVYRVIQYENDKKEAHDKLKNLNPKFCPDYWTNSNDPCEGHMCKPTFDEAGGTVYMSAAFNTHGTPIGMVKDNNGLGVCETRESRLYPWVEIDNACDARERKV